MPRIIETTIFTEELKDLYDGHHSTPGGYRELQNALLEGAAKGDVIKGTGGLRKMRWGTRTSGKSQGLRVIYYRYRHDDCDVIYLVYVYRKSKQTDLTEEQKSILKSVVARLKESIEREPTSNQP